VVRAHHLQDLVGLGRLTDPAASLLEASVAAGLNILVSGATQAGNPTNP
jgi:pilus assembly protein CpaF